MRTQSYYKRCLKLLDDIHKKYPSLNMGKHLSTSLDGYDIWSISDKELLFSLEKYTAELEMDVPHFYKEENIEEIIQGGLHLDNILEDNAEEDNIY